MASQKRYAKYPNCNAAFTKVVGATGMVCVDVIDITAPSHISWRHRLLAR